jgi:hypothetical protein
MLGVVKIILQGFKDMKCPTNVLKKAAESDIKPDRPVPHRPVIRHAPQTTIAPGSVFVSRNLLLLRA